MKKCEHKETIALSENSKWCQHCGAVQFDHPQVRRDDWMLPKKERKVYEQKNKVDQASKRNPQCSD
jgi:hypothetical protein